VTPPEFNAFVSLPEDEASDLERFAMINHHHLSFGEAMLHYTQSGKGDKKLLLFHGFGQNRHAFEQWTEHLGDMYTLYSFDLFFHGQSHWPMRQPLKKSDWKEIITTFLSIHHIHSFEVAGFSMGGKFALLTLEWFPDRINHLILMAPDGVKTSFWYSLATYPWAARSLFKSMILKPSRLFTLITVLRRFQLVDKGLLRFAESQMSTEEKRRRVYYSWVYFRNLKFNVHQIAALLNTAEIPLTMIAGRFDRVIKPQDMKRFCQNVNHATYIEIESGHNELINRVLPNIWQVRNEF
jgi:pimeloyl-ACP methyl ester carboxylesterase